MTELPYFKFFTNEWILGDITMCSYDAQGLFINICSFYWSKECILTLKNLNQRFKKCENLIAELIENDILKDNGEYVKIEFLDAQLEELAGISVKRSKAGKASAESKRLAKLEQEENKCLTSVEQDGNKTQQLREEEIRKEKIKKDKKKKSEQILTEREKDFQHTLEPFIKDYTKAMIRKFYDYWSEPTKNQKMKFELEKTWDVGRRLKRWNNNNFSNNEDKDDTTQYKA